MIPGVRGEVGRGGGEAGRFQPPLLPEGILQLPSPSPPAEKQDLWGEA